MISYTRPNTKRKISLKAKAVPFSKIDVYKVFICMIYNKHYRNEGFYYNQKDLIKAVKAFNEIYDEFENDR